jgi:integrase
MAEVIRLAEEMPAQHRIAVYLAAWCQLRRGEVRGLRRRDIDLDKGTLSVNETRTTTMSGQTVVKSPKTRAGKRTIAIPQNVIDVLSDHLDAFVDDNEDALVVSVTDRSLGLAWRKARRVVGRPDLRFHDLSHSGLTWAAETGASLAELMRRAGHASQGAAIRYQHATDRRDRVLADALAGMSERPDANAQNLEPGGVG